jgi:protein phosphatase 1L
MPLASAAGSPLRPFSLRAQIPEEASPTPQKPSIAGSGLGGSVLKRRRPAPLLVPVDGAAVAATAAEAVAAVESDPSNEVEEQGMNSRPTAGEGGGEGWRWRMAWHVAKVALGGDPKW